MQSEQAPILEVDHLNSSYDGQPLLQDIGFSLNEGEILCLLGPSGSGKTTLLRLLAGLEQEDSGTLIFNGHDLTTVPPHKRNIGMMFQEYALFPHKNVWQNIAFGLEMQNCSPGEQNRRIGKLLELVGLTGFAERKVDELSGGERQRVALARSLAPQPQLLLLDEPLGSLDRTLRERLTTEIRAILKALGVSAIFVTHDQAEAFSVADKVAVLYNGILQQFAAAEQIYRTPANRIVAEFLGFTNYIAGRVIDNRYFQADDAALKDLQEVPIELGSTEPTTLLIRTDGATLSNDKHDHNTGSTRRINGRVRGVRFLGGSYRLELLAGKQSLVFNLPIDPKPPAIGEQVELTLHPAAIIFLR